MQKAFVLVPAALFFIIYKLYDFYYATAALMISVTALTLIEWLRTRKANKIHLTSTVLLLVLGTITLLLRDPRFLVWKFSVYHWILGAYLIFTHLYRETTGLQAFFSTITKFTGGSEEDELDLNSIPQEKYRKGNLAAILYFVFVGFINLVIWNLWGESAWVNFKIFGITGLNAVFIMTLMIWLFYGQLAKDTDS